MTILKFDHARPPAAVNLQLLQRVRRAFIALDPKNQTWILNLIEDLRQAEAECRERGNPAQAVEKGGP